MKERLLRMLNAKLDEKKKLQERAAKSEDVKELRSINEKMDPINKEIEEFRAALSEIESTEERQVSDPRTDAVNESEQVEGAEERSTNTVSRMVTGFIPVANTTSSEGESRAVAEEKELETRGKSLKEERSVTVASSGLILPKYAADTITGTFNQVSSLVDGVTYKPLLGGESYQKPYIKSYGTGDYTSETGTPPSTEPVFGYAPINKAKITAYAEDTEEVEKLPSAPYALEVQKGIKIALRKKQGAEILVGDGQTNHLMGIFNSLSIDSSTDLKISEITNTTLDDILFGFGGDEDVEDAAVLMLNKLDLKAFSQLRTTDGKKFHTIVTRGNSGTIDGIPYIINSACKAISLDTTVDGDFCMAYGPLSNYEVAVFSDTEIKKSTDYKFKEGMTAHRGVVFMGGNVVAHNGFIRVKKLKTI